MKQTFKILTLAVLIASVTTIVCGQKMKAEDVVAKHLESIGTKEARDAAKIRIAVGDATAKFTSTKDQAVQGRIVLASDGEKNFLGLNMSSVLYPGERFVYNGKDTGVAMVQQNSRSLLGNFVLSNGMLLRDGLLAGTLSSSWLMLDAIRDKGKLSYDGLKSVGGKDAYALGYSRKGGGDISVTFYFDKDTFRHVRTEYKRTSSAGIGGRPEDSTRFNESRLKVVEDFDDFRPEGGLTLPHSYRIFYSITGQNGTTEIEWMFKLTEFAFDRKLDPNTFSVQ